MAKLALILLALGVGVTPAFAEDWVAQKLRGKVLELVDGTWQPLERGDAVPEGNVVRTLGNTRVIFQRGSETVELGPDTQVQFFQRDSDGFTTVSQYFGEVKVEADVEKVRHFAVQTPFLAAVVKGTIFTVRSDDKGASVAVERGAVGVTSTGDHSSVTVRAGQEAHTGDSGTLEVSGKGVLPSVVDAAGAAVAATAADDTASGNSGNGNGNGSGNSGSNGHSGEGNNGNGNGNSGNSGNSGHGNNGNSGNSGNSGHGGGDDEDEAEDEDD